MSTEPNTQRAIVLTIDECAKQFELYAQSNDGRNIERAHAYRHCSEFLTEFCKQPPPETGAVDVEKFLPIPGWHEPTGDDLFTMMLRSDPKEQRQQLKAIIAPLTARISELERTLETITKGSFEASQAMAAVNAELRARVKELEAKLSSTQSTPLSSPTKLPEPGSPDAGACNPASTSDTGTRTPPADS